VDAEDEVVAAVDVEVVVCEVDVELEEVDVEVVSLLIRKETGIAVHVEIRTSPEEQNATDAKNPGHHVKELVLAQPLTAHNTQILDTEVDIASRVMEDNRVVVMVVAMEVVVDMQNRVDMVDKVLMVVPVMVVLLEDSAVAVEVVADSHPTRQ